jgi:hypothetical protein
MDAQRRGQSELADVVDELAAAFAVPVDDRQLSVSAQRLAHALGAVDRALVDLQEVRGDIRDPQRLRLELVGRERAVGKAPVGSDPPAPMYSATGVTRTSGSASPSPTAATISWRRPELSAFRLSGRFRVTRLMCGAGPSIRTTVYSMRTPACGPGLYGQLRIGI